MPPERWQRVKELFEVALEHTPDGRGILFQYRGRLYLIESQSKKSHEVLSVAPHEFGNGVTLPRDDRMIYYCVLTTEADIWLMTLE